MKALKFALAAGVAMSFSGAAEAKKPSFWVQCDGYAKPSGGGTKLVKGLATLGTLGLFGIPETHNPEARGHGAAGVAACTTALADPAAANASWIRKVTLHQALAAHHLEAKNAEAAMTALDAAQAAAGENRSDPFFGRSTGVSLDLLRSVALLRLGRTDEANEAAVRAAEARPYSARVQMIALALMGFDEAVLPAEATMAERLTRLDPSSMVAADIYLRGGRYQDAWKLLSAQYELKKQQPPKDVGLGMLLNDDSLGTALLTAFTAARVGEIDTARAILDDQAAAVSRTAEQLRKMKLSLSSAAADEVGALEEALMKPIESWRPMIEAAGLLAGGDALGAQEKLAGAQQFAANPLLAALTADLRARIPAEARKGLVAIEPADLRDKFEQGREARLDKLATVELLPLLPEPEDEKRLNSFSRQAGWGLKPTGFKHKKLDSGLTRIEFVGSSSSPLAVEEMTLLRAAKLAEQAGSKGFVITRRSDYTRWSQMTMNGVPVGAKTMAGYKTEIDVRFVDDLSAAAAQDAAALAATLTPIYVREKEAKRR
jgi:hypothetical protein